MKQRQWMVRRGSREMPDAQRRWDQAYQHLLHAREVTLSIQETQHQENHDEHCGLRSRFDTTTSTGTNHRTTTGQCANLS